MISTKHVLYRLLKKMLMIISKDVIMMIIKKDAIMMMININVFYNEH